MGEGGTGRQTRENEPVTITTIKSLIEQTRNQSVATK